MADNRYIAIRVAYERHSRDGRRLASIAPELRDAGLTMTEDDDDGPTPSRTWVGIVDRPTFELFADAWRLEATPHSPVFGLVTESGEPAVSARAYTLDGMNWEVNGESPIVYVSLLVGVVQERDRRVAGRSGRRRSSARGVPAGAAPHRRRRARRESAPRSGS